MKPRERAELHKDVEVLSPDLQEHDAAVSKNRECGREGSGGEWGFCRAPCFLWGSEPASFSGGIFKMFTV